MIETPHLSIAMLDAYKGLGSTGKLLPTVLYAKNWTSMKVPVGIDLRKASFTLYQFTKGAGFVKPGKLGSSVGRSSGPTIPFKIKASASVARGNCDWDNAAIFSRNCFLMVLLVSSCDSSNFLTSRETCTTNISGKLRHRGEHLRVARARE